MSDEELKRADDALSRLSRFVLDKWARDGAFNWSATWQRIEVREDGELTVREIRPEEVYLAANPPGTP